MNNRSLPLGRCVLDFLDCPTKGLTSNKYLAGYNFIIQALLIPRALYMYQTKLTVLLVRMV